MKILFLAGGLALISMPIISVLKQSSIMKSHCQGEGLESLWVQNEELSKKKLIISDTLCDSNCQNRIKNVSIASHEIVSNTEAQKILRSGDYTLPGRSEPIRNSAVTSTSLSTAPEGVDKFVMLATIFHPPADPMNPSASQEAHTLLFGYQVSPAGGLHRQVNSVLDFFTGNNWSYCQIE